MVLEAANAKAKNACELTVIARGLGKGSSGDASESFLQYLCVNIRQSPYGKRGSRGGAEDLPKMRVQRIDPDFLKRRDLLVVFFEFASTLSSSEPDPVSGSVGRAGKVRDFHEAFQQHRFIAVAPAPVGAEWFGDGGQDARGQPRAPHPG